MHTDTVSNYKSQRGNILKIAEDERSCYLEFDKRSLEFDRMKTILHII